MIRVSVVVPVYNEAGTIVDILAAVQRQRIDGVAFEVIVVDDGSTDRTPELLAENPGLYKTLLRLPTNGGKGAAVKAALRVADGDYVLFQDADLEYDPADYDKLMKPVKRFKADVVMGSRMMAPQYTRVYYFWHKVGNGIISLLFNVLYNMTFTDIYSCYLMYRRELVDPDSLRSVGWEQHAEILCKAVGRASVIYEVPVSYHGRSYDEGKKIKPRHAAAVLWMIVKQRFLG